MAIDKEGQLKRIDIDGVIYFDSVLGIAGTTYPIGTRELPSNTIADVITLCALHNIRHINVRGALTLGVAMTAYRFDGYKHLDIAHLIDLNGQDVSVSSFHRLIITGAQAGAGLASYDDCMLLTVTGFNGVATLCGFITSLTLNAATSSGFINCFSYLGPCTINLGNPTLANFVNLTGSFTLANQTAGVTNIWAANGCEITIAASCTGGIINIYGNARVTGAGGGVTINNYSLQATLGLTTYTAHSVGATDVNGTTWEDLLDMSALTKPEEIWSITLTVAGGWAGLCKYRIVRADTSAKIFPFGAECIENTDFVSGVPVNFPAPIVVPVAVGYKIQFRSTNAGDGAGKTCALTELAVIERG